MVGKLHHWDSLRHRGPNSGIQYRLYDDDDWHRKQLQLHPHKVLLIILRGTHFLLSQSLRDTWHFGLHGTMRDYKGPAKNWRSFWWLLDVNNALRLGCNLDWCWWGVLLDLFWGKRDGWLVAGRCIFKRLLLGTRLQKKKIWICTDKLKLKD